MHEQICGADVFLPPEAFGQANLAGYERILRQVEYLSCDYSGFLRDARQLKDAASV